MVKREELITYHYDQVDIEKMLKDDITHNLDLADIDVNKYELIIKWNDHHGVTVAIKKIDQEGEGFFFPKKSQEKKKVESPSDNPENEIDQEGSS